MDATETKLVIEAALLAAGRPLPFEKLVELFTQKGDAPDRATIREGLEALAADYEGRGIELKEVANGFRIQIRSSMTDRLQPLWEERAPRYTRALLETLALIAYRQPITRSEIEEVRGVAVSSNIVRTLMERGWVRVVGHRDVPGKPAMLGTTREFLDYFGLKKLEDLPALTEFNEEHPELSPQADLKLVESLDEDGGAAGGTDELAGEAPAATRDDVAADHVPAAETSGADAVEDRVAQGAQTPQAGAALEAQAAPQEQPTSEGQAASEGPEAHADGQPRNTRDGAAKSASEEGETSTEPEPDDPAGAPQAETPPQTKQSESGGL